MYEQVQIHFLFFFLQEKRHIFSRRNEPEAQDVKVGELFPIERRILLGLRLSCLFLVFKLPVRLMCCEIKTENSEKILIIRAHSQLR